MNRPIPALRVLSLAATGWLMLPHAVAAQTTAAALAPTRAVSLREAYEALGPRLEHTPFRRPMWLQSNQTDREVSGDIYVLLDYSYATVHAALGDAAHWCDVLMLHLNTKSCRATSDPPHSVVTLRVGETYEQTADRAFRLAFDYQLGVATDEFFELTLDAPRGPVGTHDYRIQLEAVAVDGRRTFAHLHYAYGYGVLGKVAMQLYFLTFGRGKIGFTVTGHDAAGQPTYVTGLLGLLERNTLRYELAIEAYLATLDDPPDQRLQHRLERWFDATEAFSPQLHEMGRDEYLAMKRREMAALDNKLP